GNRRLRAVDHTGYRAGAWAAAAGAGRNLVIGVSEPVVARHQFDRQVVVLAEGGRVGGDRANQRHGRRWWWHREGAVLAVGQRVACRAVGPTRVEVRAAIDRVGGPVLRRELVGPGTAAQLVWARTNAVQLVRPVTAVERVGSVVAGQLIGRGATDHVLEVRDRVLTGVRVLGAG